MINQVKTSSADKEFVKAMKIALSTEKLGNQVSIYFEADRNTASVSAFVPNKDQSIHYCRLPQTISRLVMDFWDTCAEQPEHLWNWGWVEFSDGPENGIVYLYLDSEVVYGVAPLQHRNKWLRERFGEAKIIYPPQPPRAEPPPAKK